MARGTVVVIAAKELVGHDAEGADSYWWQDLAEHRWGKSRWALELEVRPDVGDPYRVRDVVKMPNRLHRLRNVLKGPARLRPGVILPVDIDDRDPGRLDVDWKAFAEADGVEQLYPQEPGLRESVRTMLDDLRQEQHAATPDVPRPTPETHPPVEGVDYDLFVRTSVGFAASGRPGKEWDAYCEEHGYPPGRVTTINAQWFRRAAEDPVVGAWYAHETSGGG